MGPTTAHAFLGRLLGLVLALALITGADGGPGKTRTAAILARVLSYELTLEDRAGDSVAVAVIYKEGDPASEANADEWHRALSQLSSVRIKDRPFVALKVAYGSNELRAAIENDGVDVLLASDGLAAETSSIAQIARAHHVLTAGNSVSYLEHGLTLCVTEEDGKPKIFINLNYAQLEGIRFSSSLLKLATLVH